MIYNNWLVNLQQEVRNWVSKFSWCLGSIYFYSRIICRCESSLNNSNFIFFKRNTGEVLIFVLEKFLEAGYQLFNHWSKGVVFFATILAVFWYSAMDLLSRYLLWFHLVNGHFKSVIQLYLGALFLYHYRLISWISSEPRRTPARQFRKAMVGIFYVVVY